MTVVEADIGWTGVAVLVLLFALLGAEDVLIWLRGGVVPGIEFFLATLVVMAVVALSIRNARAHPPPWRRRP